MTANRQNPPPKKGPGTEADLEALYRRRLVVRNLIRSMEAYVRNPGAGILAAKDAEVRSRKSA